MDEDSHIEAAFCQATLSVNSARKASEAPFIAQLHLRSQLLDPAFQARVLAVVHRHAVPPAHEPSAQPSALAPCSTSLAVATQSQGWILAGRGLEEVRCQFECGQGFVFVHKVIDSLALSLETQSLRDWNSVVLLLL